MLALEKNSKIHTSLRIKIKSSALRTPTNWPFRKSQRGAIGTRWKYIKSKNMKNRDNISNIYLCSKKKLESIKQEKSYIYIQDSEALKVHFM